MGFSFLLGILLFVGGALGIPMGMPPGPEDPLMAKVAPENCLVYASWSGVAKLDPDANPTEKWMSQPKTSKLIPKIRKAYRGYFLKFAENSGDRYYKHLNRIMIEVVDAAGENPAAFYLDGIEIEASKDPKATGAVVVNLGDQKETVAKLVGDLHKWYGELDPKEASILFYEAIEIDGKKGLKIFSGVSDRPILVVIRDGYFILGLGEDSAQKAIANMKTPAPKWLDELRAENKVERTASVAYLNGKVVDTLVTKGGFFDPFWINNTEWMEGVKSIGWVCGLDSKGFVAHTSVRLEKDRKSLFALVDQDSIPKRDLKHIPADSTIGFATRLSTEKIMELIRDSFKSQSQREMYDDLLKQAQDLSGVSLEKELLNSVGNYIYVYFDLDFPKLMGDSNSGWVVSVKIKDEMSFPEYLRQINKGIKNWASETDQFEYSVKKYDQYEICSVTPDKRWQTKVAWTMVDDEWLFAPTTSELIEHIKRRKKENQYLANEYAQEIYKFGDEQGYGAPLSIGHLNFPDILNEFQAWIDPATDGDSKISPDVDILLSDIPKVKELVNGVKSNYAAVFKTKKGYHIYQRQTYPGGSPAVTFGAFAIASIPSRMGTLSVQKRMHQIGQAHLKFEKKHKRFVGAHSLTKDGSHALSWRVHLLPFLGHQELYDQFRLDEPWNSEHNMKLIEKMPGVYKHPTMKLENGKTAFLVPTANGGVFDQSGDPGELTPLGIRSDQIKDDRAQTALLLEVNKDNSVVWTKPGDFAFPAKEISKRMSGIRESRHFVFVLCNCEVKTGNNYYWNHIYRHVLDRDDGQKVKLPSMFGW